MESDENALLLALLLVALTIGGESGGAAESEPPAPGGAEAAPAVAAPPAPAVAAPPAPAAAGPVAPARPEAVPAVPAGRHQVIRPLLTAQGTVTRVDAEADGHVQLLLRPDPKYIPLVGERNFALAGGNLVVGVAPTDRGRLGVPVVGARVRVTGPYVLDVTRGWRAIAPAMEIERVR